MGTITIRNSEVIQPEDLGLLHESINTARNHTSGPNATAEIFCTPRKSTGWLEYGMNIRDSGSGLRYVACIQRKLGEKNEFCT